MAETSFHRWVTKRIGIFAISGTLNVDHTASSIREFACSSTHVLLFIFFSLHFVHCSLLPVLFISPFQHAYPSLSNFCSIYPSFHSLTPFPLNTFIISSPICIFILLKSLSNQCCQGVSMKNSLSWRKMHLADSNIAICKVFSWCNLQLCFPWRCFD